MIEQAVISEEVQAQYKSLVLNKLGGMPSELVLIQPPLVPKQFFDVATARRGGYYNFPPMGLLYLAAAAREVAPNLTIHILDLNHEILKEAQSDDFNYDSWQNLIHDIMGRCENPHVGVTFMFGTTKPCFYEVTSFLRREYPRIPLLSGGVQASFDYKEILAEGLCDIVARKEAELQIQAYLKSLAGDGEATPEGMAFQIDNEIVEIGAPPLNSPTDWDIREFYNHIDIKDYHTCGGLGAFSKYVGTGKRFSTVLAARGCRARCTFCTVRNFNNFGLRQRSVQNVVDEVKFLVEKKGIDYIDWLDDDLLWDPKRTVDLFKTLAEQVPGLEWTASNGLIGVAITDEIMYWMVQSGLQAFKIGIESGNDKMLKTIKKPTTKAKLREKKKVIAKYPSVLFSANFIIGFPEETFGQMMDTYNFAVELETDWASFYICQPLKGTEMYSAFETLGDARCKGERYDKTINPGRSSERGEFGYQFKEDEERLKTGWDIFSLPPDSIPSLEQQKEIWFTFNFVANFLDNPNFNEGGNTKKIAKWLEAIHDGYPYDASMAAALTHAYFLMDDKENFERYQRSFLELTADSSYWQQRVHQFPEMLLLAHLQELPAWFQGQPVKRLVRNIEGVASTEKKLNENAA